MFRVDSNKKNPIIFINESSELYLPKRIEPQTKNKLGDLKYLAHWSEINFVKTLQLRRHSRCNKTSK